MRLPVRRLADRRRRRPRRLPGDDRAGVGRARREPPGKPVTVMSRNLYLGANIQRPVDAALAAQAAGGTRRRSSGRSRRHPRHPRDRRPDRLHGPGRLLADEIVAARPDLVGLQEVALWRSGPLDLDHVGVPDATTVDYDFLAHPARRAAARGAPTRPSASATGADVEAPVSPAARSTERSAAPRDVRMTMRDVILVRRRAAEGGRQRGRGLRLQPRRSTIAGSPLSFNRGYQWVDVRPGVERFRFVNTHLEAFSSDLALAQASELLGEAAPARP